jgi:hypothetical protein
MSDRVEHMKIETQKYIQWLYVLRYLEYADHQWPTFYSSRIDGLLFPHIDCYKVFIEDEIEV